MTCNNCIHFGVCRLENETPARCQHFMPNIVRCKDCKYFHSWECAMVFEETISWDDDGYTEWDDITHDRAVENGFCDRGEKT